jgi:pre-mRNA-splicing factor 18
MDLQSLLKARGLLKDESSITNGEKTFTKGAETEAQREAAYLEEQHKAEESRQGKLKRKLELEEAEAEKERIRKEKRLRIAEESRRRREEEKEAAERARRKRLGLPELPPKKKDDEEPKEEALPEGEEDIPDEELSAKLEGLKEPAKLEGESHTQRLKRYWRLIGKDTTPKLSNTIIPTTLPLLPEAEMKVPAKAPSDAAGKKLVYNQLASYFTMVLTQWENAMMNRSDEVKASSDGKRAYTSFRTACEDLVPLFRKMETSALDADLLQPLLDIVHSAQERRYVAANDAYLTLSIGKAAWPIGVTMVGIHERSAREKIGEGEKKAHIMSDEGTRKWLQSVKRCLSFAQVRWPPEDAGQLMG